MMEFLLSMGPYLLPLLIISVYAVGLILSKNGELNQARALPSDEFERLLSQVSSSQHSGVELPESHPLAVILSIADRSTSVLQARAQAIVARLEDRIGYFPALANVATLGGLFGTVCGMIGVFLSLRGSGGADPSALAAGLGQALVATALGLLTAIPALAAHAVFQKRIHATAGQLESLLSALLPVGPGAGRD